MRVEVFVDVICPGCHIARRLEQALEQFDHGDGSRSSGVLELDLAPPSGGRSTVGTRRQQAHAGEQVLVMVERVEAVARGEGLVQLDAPGTRRRAPVAASPSTGLQGALKARLDRASFVEGVGVGPRGAGPLVVEVGLDRPNYECSPATATPRRCADERGPPTGHLGRAVLRRRRPLRRVGCPAPRGAGRVLERAWSERTGAAAT